MNRTFGLFEFFGCFILVVTFVRADTTETFISDDKVCETENIGGTVFNKNRTFSIKYKDSPFFGQYLLETAYYPYKEQCYGESNSEVVANRAEIGTYALLDYGNDQFSYTLIQLNASGKSISFNSPTLETQFLAECAEDKAANSYYDTSNISCSSFNIMSIDSCNNSIQPRDYRIQSYFRLGKNDSVWCDWESDSNRNLSDFGYRLEYKLTNLEKAEKTFNDVINVIQLVLMCASILGSFLTIITFLIFPRIRTYPIKLICWLCLSILLGQIIFLITAYEAKGTNFCEAGGALVHYLLFSNFTWCSCLAFNFYQLIVKRNSQTRDLEKYYHLFGWGLPLLFVMAVGIANYYGVSGQVCYMNNSWAVFLAFFLPGLIILAANFVLFFFVSTEIHGTLSKAPQTEQKSKENTKEFRVLFSIFVTVGLTWLFGFIVAIADFDKSRISYFIFSALFTITAPAQGLFVFIAYCINKKVLNRWKGLFGCSVSETEQTTSATASGRSSRGATKSTGSSTTSSRMD